ATVFDELAHGLRLQRVPGDEIARRVDKVLERFDLTHKARTHPFLLSGGEKRRLSVGTQIITRPQVLALDEPTFGQDHDRAIELLDLLSELQAEGTTVVVVTHDLRLVAERSTHAVVLRDGTLHAAGQTAGILADRALLTDAGLLPPTPAPHGWRTSLPLPARQRDPSAAAGGGGETPPAAPAELRDPSDPEGTTGASTAPTPTDPYAEAPVPARFWLHHLNPLAKAGAVLPAMIALVFTRDPMTPAIFFTLSYLMILTGARLTRRSAVLLFAVIPIGLAAIGLGFSLWVSHPLVAHTAPVLRLGGWTLYAGAIEIGLVTALRLGAILALALVGGLTTTGPQLVRAGIRHLRVPYRVGYTALAAYRFVPRFGYELGVIRAAHRVRGHHGGRGPFARLARGWGYIVPLLAGGIRHAERVALAMDARAFGAHPTRTERHPQPWLARDTAFTVAVLAASVAVLIVTFPWQPF
ncbi:MAG: CbiQ family ECF transporter T component, partial [Microbacterium sp.]